MEAQSAAAPRLARTREGDSSFLHPLDRGLLMLSPDPDRGLPRGPIRVRHPRRRQAEGYPSRGPPRHRWEHAV